jgi:uncharacterized membrane protein YtjA (UPF0391 family)
MSLIGLGIVLLVLAVVFYAVGANGIGGMTAEIGKLILVVGLILAVLFIVFGGWHYYYP